MAACTQSFVLGGSSMVLSTAFGFGTDHLLHPSLYLLSPSCFRGPFSNHVMLPAQACNWCFTALPLTSAETASAPQDKEENSSTSAQAICHLSLAHLAFCHVNDSRWDNLLSSTRSKFARLTQTYETSDQLHCFSLFVKYRNYFL